MTRSMRVLSISATAVLLATGVAVAQRLTVDINRISEAGVGDKNRHRRDFRNEGRRIF